jgi:hypothetical protein
LLVERPDYAKMESTNRISTVGGSWTASETGYVMLSGASTTSGKNLYIYVGGKQVWAAGTLYVIQVVPVVKGDVILTAVDSGGSASYIQCRFIPSKFIVVKNPTLVIEEGSDYSFEELPVMRRLPDGTGEQKTWIDGKPIWGKTIAISATFSANTSVNVATSLTGVYDLISQKGTVTLISGNKVSIPYAITETSRQRQIYLFLNTTNNTVTFDVKYDVAGTVSGNAYVEYTKL